MMIIMTRMWQCDGSANKRSKPGERFVKLQQIWWERRRRRDDHQQQQQQQKVLELGHSAKFFDLNWWWRLLWLPRTWRRRRRICREKFMAGMFLLFPFATTSFMTDPVMLQRGESGVEPWSGESATAIPFPSEEAAVGFVLSSPASSRQNLLLHINRPPFPPGGRLLACLLPPPALLLFCCCCCCLFPPPPTRKSSALSLPASCSEPLFFFSGDFQSFDL